MRQSLRKPVDPPFGRIVSEGAEAEFAPRTTAGSATRMYLSGVEALAHLPLLQRLRDAAAGLNTAGFVSGYRGSPLGGLDQALWKLDKLLKQHHIQFQPGLNEDLGATMVWGTQQVNLFAGAKYDGVFALWYGKGPGVDRSLDVLKHANAAGTSRHGGVLAVAGDDHAARSSTLPHQSEHVFSAAMIPLLNPSGVQEYLDLGIHGWAMSRYSGCWVALKATADTVESSASVVVDPYRVDIVLPDDAKLPPAGLNDRWPDPPLEQELRVQHYKVYAAMAYARANQLNRIVIDSAHPRMGIITAGKSYLDVRQALDFLGIDDAMAGRMGLRVYKVGMSWPLDAVGVRHFAEGLEEILVVEEKRQFMEYQLKEQLYNWREDVRPRVTGKYDESGEWDQPWRDWQLPAAGELTPAMIARVIARRVLRFHSDERIRERLAFLEAKQQAVAARQPSMLRLPHYCSGCPHNTSTMQVPEGSRVLAGIGCHYMATWLAPATTQTFSQMGGEGVAWAGQAPFTKTRHVFANLGDGTYQHSGLLAIRQAVAANVNITYKILYNDAVAMTGGQPVEGTLSVPMISRQLAAEGVQKIFVVTDEPQKYAGVKDLATDVPVRHRSELEAVQRELRDHPGVTALIFDQTCAAEKRRRRKRNEYPDPPVRAFINESVCEGCGDCSAKSNCMSVVPVETEFGRKRAIDQSSCNKDYSCVLGFCPSFVTVEGGTLRKGKAVASRDDAFGRLPDPPVPALNKPYGILVTGVGGSGVVTIGTLLGLAAHMEGKGISVLDMAGLAQKGGPVWSHVRIYDNPEEVHATRIADGEANAIIGCDIVVTVAVETLAKTRSGMTRAIVNTDFSVTSDYIRALSAQAETGDLTRHPDPQFPLETLQHDVVEAVGAGNAEFFAATRLATALMGDSIATNAFMLGYAYQKGLVPLSLASLHQAIELHGVAVDATKSALLWGRRAAHDLAAVEKAAAQAIPDDEKLSASLDELIDRRVKDLTAYQNAAYAQRYTTLVERVRVRETAIRPGSTRLTEGVARFYYKLLSYKDEYEVARLYTDGAYVKNLHATFEGDFRLYFYMAPPLWAKPDPVTGERKKRRYGPWMFSALKLLAKLKSLRGTAFDPFRHSEDRKLDRRLVTEYERMMEEVLADLDERNYAVAVELASLPDRMRGYGHIKKRYVEHAKTREAELLARFRSHEVARVPAQRSGQAAEVVA
jgi:indolepyruvate ferredoxin oxidoreductase